MTEHSMNVCKRLAAAEDPISLDWEAALDEYAQAVTTVQRAKDLREEIGEVLEDGTLTYDEFVEDLGFSVDLWIGLQPGGAKGFNKTAFRQGLAAFCYSEENTSPQMAQDWAGLVEKFLADLSDPRHAQELRKDGDIQDVLEDGVMTKAEFTDEFGLDSRVWQALGETIPGQKANFPQLRKSDFIEFALGHTKKLGEMSWEASIRKFVGDFTTKSKAEQINGGDLLDALKDGVLTHEEWKDLELPENLWKILVFNEVTRSLFEEQVREYAKMIRRESF